MKILLISIQGNSGSDVYYQRLFEGLKENNHDNNINIFFINKRFQFFPFLIPLYLKIKKELHGYDIVQTNIEYAYYFKGLGGKLIGIMHHNVIDVEYQKFTSIIQKIYHYGMLKYTIQKSINAVDIIIAVSNFTKQSFEDNFIVKKQVHVIYNGINLDKFKPIEEYKKLCIDRDYIRLLFIGNQSRRKGWDIVVNTMKKFSQEGKKIKLFYTGLRDKTSQNLEQYNMYCLGKLSEDEIVKQYNIADYLYFPTRLEGFGYAVVESIACGTPVISNGGSSLDEIINLLSMSFYSINNLFLYDCINEIYTDTIMQFNFKDMIKHYVYIYKQY